MATNPIAEAAVRLRGDGSQLESDASGTFGRVAKAAGAIFAGVQVVRFLESSIADGRESIRVMAQTGAVIKSTGGAAHVTAGQVDELANSISRKTGIDDESIAKAENMLLTFTNVRNEVGAGNDIFNQAARTVTDMGAALGGDPVTNSIKLGKALNDPEKGLTALTRVGVTFSEQQKDMVKAMVASGDKLGAQKLILAELNKEFGGSAEAQATASDKMKVAWDNFKEDVGMKMIPTVDAVETQITTRLIPVLEKMLNFITGPFASSVGRGFGIFADVAAKIAAPIERIAGDVSGKLSPALNGLAGKGHALSDLFPPAFVDFISKHSQDITGVAAAMLTLGVSGAVAGQGVAALGAPAKFAAEGLSRLVGPAISAGGSLIGLAASIGPVGWIIIAVVAAVALLVTAFIYAYTHIKPFRDFVDGLVSTLRDGLGAALGWLTGTALPALSAAWSAVVGAFSTAMDAIRNGVSTAIGWVVKFVTGWDFFNDHVGPLLVAFAGLIEAIANRVVQGFQIMMQVVSVFVEGARQALEPFAVALSAVFDLAIGLIETGWSVLWTIITTTMQVAFAIISPIWSAAWELISGAVSIVWDTIRTIIGTALDFIRGIITIATGLINGDWSQAWDGIKLILDTVWNLMKTTVSDAIEAVRLAIDTALGLIKGLWSGAWDAVKLALSGAWEIIKTTVSGGIDAIKTVISGGLDTIVSFFSGLPQRAVDALVAIVSLLTTVGTNAITGLFNGLSNHWTDVFNWFGKLPGFAFDALSSFAGKMYDVGAAALQALWNGMKSIWDHVTGWLSSLNPASWFNDINLELGHAAVNLLPTGQMVMSGLLTGMQQGWAKTADWLSTLDPSMVVGADGIGRSVSSNVAAGAGSPGGVVIDASLVFHEAVYGDSKLEAMLDSHANRVQDLQRTVNLQGRRAA